MTTFETAAVTSHSAPPRGGEGMLNAFRALGGRAENIRLGHGPFGRGLFPLDRTRPVLLSLPQNLLFPVGDVEFVGDRIRISDASEIGQPERDFFEAYENAFSWGGGGRSESAAAIAALEALPAEIRGLLISDFGMDQFLEGDPAKRAENRFLESRFIEWKGRHVLAPLIELANYSPSGLAYSRIEDRLEIRGTPQDEVLVDYGAHDSFKMFYRFALASPQPLAHSLPMRTRLDHQELTIAWNNNHQVRRGSFVVPQLKRDGAGLTLSCLMIGNAKFPRLPRGIFQTLLREAGAENPDEAFDYILHFNRNRFLSLLAALESHEGPMISMLRRVARYQLEAMTHCIGTRDL